MLLTSATIDNFGNPTTVKIGDHVGFKSDFEQYGKIVKIEKNPWSGDITLFLENPGGFGGDYLRYSKTTSVSTNDCWV